MTPSHAKPSLYGQRPSKPAPPSDPSPSSHAFTTTLTSLLAASTPSTSSNTTTGRSRPSKTKSSIFTTHNRNTKKRALADLQDAEDGRARAQKHSKTSEEVDEATIARSRRKMEEKARLYASMKRGEYVPPSDGRRDKEGEGLVDFDRKWAERIDAGGEESSDEISSDEDEREGGGDEEMVEYEDEFGRLRTGTKSEVERETRKRAAQAHAREELAQSTARPVRPDTLIHGDTIQSAAFNPDAPIATAMDNLARKRDRSMTPPEEVHYDASKEVRTKGVGFYQFSKDSEGRKAEMEALGREREETERGRREREERREKKKRDVEERRKIIAGKRGEKLAERFLQSLG